MKRLPPDAYTVGWVSALPIELAAATRMLDEEHKKLPYDKQDPNAYTLGRIGNHNVALVCFPAGQVGTNTAAAVTTRMLAKFTAIEFCLMVGIGGGVPSAESDIRLGDVVVSHPEKQYAGVVQYDLGKKETTGNIRTGFLNSPPPILLNAVAEMRSNYYLGRSSFDTYMSVFHEIPRFSREKAGVDILFEAGYNHIDGNTCDKCDQGKVIQRPARDESEIEIHYGTIASGNQVIKDGVTRDKISVELGRVLAFEMEAAGLMNNSPCLVIRGICDYADSHKNKRWQPYAAASAAACAKEVLSLIPTLEEEVSQAVDNGKSKSAPKAYFKVSFPRNKQFVGRESQLNILKEKVIEEEYSPRVAVYGLGGVGKTQIVLELAYRIRDNHPAYSIFWIRASSAENFEQGYLQIGELLNIPGIREKDANFKQLVKQRLSEEEVGPWLLILDNADDADIWVNTPSGNSNASPLIDYLPLSQKGIVIFTTRDRKSALKLAPKNCLEVREIDENIATDLLNGSLHRPVIANDPAIRLKLFQKLTYLPLAIVQAIAYINANDISIEKYISLFDETDDDAIQMLSEDFEDDGRDRESKNAIATTWLVSFELISSKDPLAADFLSFMSCLDTVAIPESLLPDCEPRKRTAAIGTLTAFSFITKRTDDSGEPGLDDELFDVHRLVYLATRCWLLQKNKLEYWSVQALTRLGDVFSCDNDKNRTDLRGYVPHGLHLFRSWPNDKEDECMLTFTTNFGNYLHFENEELALEVLRKSVELSKKALGEEHADTTNVMYALAMLLLNKGGLREAEELLVRVKDIRVRNHCKDHIRTLEVVHGLSILCLAENRILEALKLLLYVKEASIQNLGMEHSLTRSAIRNLATTYLCQGWRDEGEVLLQSLISTSAHLPGKEEDPDHILTLQMLAAFYALHGRKGCEKFISNIHDTLVRVRGKYHPLTSGCKEQLAVVYGRQGRFKESEELLVQLYTERRQRYGMEHEATFHAAMNLARAWSKLGFTKKSQSLLLEYGRYFEKRPSPENHYLQHQVRFVKTMARLDNMIPGIWTGENETI